jgi:D-lyxose ketol-isomerase
MRHGKYGPGRFEKKGLTITTLTNGSVSCVCSHMLILFAVAEIPQPVEVWRRNDISQR